MGIQNQAAPPEIAGRALPWLIFKWLSRHWRSIDPLDTVRQEVKRG